MENTKVNTNMIDWVELEEWLDKVCVPYPTNDCDNQKKKKRQHQEYREAYNTYLYEFENC